MRCCVFFSWGRCACITMRQDQGNDCNFIFCYFQSSPSTLRSPDNIVNISEELKTFATARNDWISFLVKQGCPNNILHHTYVPT